MGSERRVLSAEARRALELLLAGRSLDEAAPRGSAIRAEVEAHLIASLEEPRAGGPLAKAPRSRTRGSAGAPKAASSSRSRVPSSSRVPPARAGFALAYSDGASRGNPGPAAVGIRILAPDGTELWREGRRIGRATNNVAEYRGAIAALRKAQELGVRELELRMDSELVVRQLEGKYRVKEPSLAVLKHEVDELAAGFRAIRFRHVPRGENRETDLLANEALDGEET